MPSPSSTGQAIARLQHMTRMEVSGPSMIGPLLQALHGVIGFDSSAYMHPADTGELAVHMEVPTDQAVVADYFDPRILRSERQVLVRSSRDFDEAVRYEQGPQLLGQLVRVPMPELERSDFYNVVMRPMGATDCMSLVLRTPRGQGIGALKFYREAGSPAFGPDEVAALSRLEPCLAHILQDDAQASANDSEVHSQGMLITTPQGRLLWLSPEAEALLPLAFGWRWRRGAGLPQELQELLQHMRAQQPIGLPTREVRTVHGDFSVRAAPMKAATGMGQAVGIHIMQRVPREARLQAFLQTQSLSQRQQELAYWLALDLPESQIAVRMHISANTVVYHRRQLYNSLGLQDRGELMRWLSAQGSGWPTESAPAALQQGNAGQQACG
ncbi:helix-turn-helix transcriptional regulator [Acidovorax sp.]|uniref:helix-turn-helix transcriptional regulator n=1 Tax=Acidovorax sp. TaxID=1872122 RepID=UPI003D04B83C